ncbi:hypothetical protein ACH4VR_02985 [Streptomyces sp. NPDC020883]|uniref:hypothetical protein n=1 Tax=Streptomyces sp. NPDC020883 TaxID=3365099 RepID=UPI0037ACB0F6
MTKILLSLHVLAAILAIGPVKLLAALGADPPAPAPDRSATSQLAMFTGLFNLLWAAVTILMVVRPGSSTGA